MTKYFYLLATTLMLLTMASCSKDDVTTKDDDEKGKFEISFDGHKFEGNTVSNLSAIGVRTISAENSEISFQIIMAEGMFVSGKTYDIDADNLDPMITIDTNNDGTEEVYWGVTGTFKVVSETKVEIDANFYENWLTTNPAMKVSGYISSK